MYALVDCNSFFASCEQVFRPDLRGKAVVVLSNNDGCIVARSREAKRLGIPDLVPYFQQKAFLEKQGVSVFSSNYELYGDLSDRVMKTLEQFSPELEIYSIDEAFLSLKGMHCHLPSYGRKIRDSVQKQTGMPVGVGIAPTKTLAKLASYISKTSVRCDYVCVIEILSEWQKVFAKIPTRKIWGIGSRLSTRLADQGIHTVADLMCQDTVYMRKRYSVNVARTIDELNGISCYRLEQQPEAKKQIYSTRSFGQKVTDRQSLEQSVSQYAMRACEKLRKQKQLVKTVQVFASEDHFLPAPYRRSVIIKLPIATNDTRLIIALVRRAVNEVIYREGARFARAGVGLIELQAEAPEQLDAFVACQPERSKRLMSIMDEINLKHSPIFFASQGIDTRWKMHRNLKSPSYTTRWNELPTAKV